MNKLLHFFVRDITNIKDQKQFEASYAFGIILAYVFILHVFLLAYFIYAGITFFVYYNIISLFVAGISFALSRNGKVVLSATLVSYEIILYGFISVCLLGWSTSCQWYILMTLLPHHLFIDIGSRRRIILTTFGVFAIFASFIYDAIYPAFFAIDSIIILRFANLSIVLITIFLEIKMNEIIRVSTQAVYKEHMHSLELDSYIDPLTALWNRRYAMKVFSNIAPSSCPLCVAILDIDLFKNVNDNYGHSVGDQVLSTLSNMMQSSFRSSDISVRWGGEEFLVILNNIELPFAYKVMDAFRLHVAETNFKIETHSLQITVTIGLAQFDFSGGRTIEQTIEEGDLCMYYGKNNGRNRVIYKDLIA